MGMSLKLKVQGIGLSADLLLHARVGLHFPWCGMSCRRAEPLLTWLGFELACAGNSVEFSKVCRK